MPRGAGELGLPLVLCLSIENKIPDHSAFSRARNERFRDSDIFRRVFERVVEACIAAGLVGGEGFAVDASLIVADANKFKETASGAKHDRAERKKVMALAQARKIDAILVTELSRRGRSTQDLVQTLDDLHSWKVSVSYPR